MENSCESLYQRFEKIVVQCVNTNKWIISYKELSKGDKKIIYVPLIEFILKEPTFMDCAPYILSHYNIRVFEQADKAFGKLITEQNINIAINEIAYEIVLRRLKDHLAGEYSMFGKRKNSDIKYLKQFKKINV